MQQLTREKPVINLHETLVQLRQSLAGADPLAAPTHAAFTAQVQSLTDTFEDAPQAERQALVLRALDEAIAAIELAARLADALNSAHDNTCDNSATQQSLDATHAGDQSQQTSNVAQDALFTAYRAFTESQPTYQELYHYRNALAERLRTTCDVTDDDA